MTCTAFVMTILPGQARRLRDFANALQGERRGDFEASQRRLGVDREVWFFREGPPTDLAVVYIEAADVGKSLERLVRSTEPVDLWLKKEVAAITGVDFNRPPSGPGFSPILLYGYT